MQRLHALPQTRLARTPSHPRRGAALYASVLLMSLTVAVLSLAAIQNVGVERRAGQNTVASIAARQNSLAAVRLALEDIFNDSSWRTRYQHGVETTTITFGSGSVSWSLWDTGDTSLSDDIDDSVEVRGIGRSGGAAWVHSVVLQVVPKEFGPMDLQGFVDTSSLNNDVISSSHFFGEYFQPFLPSTAITWRVTGADFYAMSDGTVSGSTKVGLYLPLSSKNPSTLLEEVVVNESALTTSMQKYHVNYSTNTGLSPSTGVCLTFTTTTSSNTMRLAYKNGTNSGSSRLLEGVPAWNTPSGTRSLNFRIYGCYTIRDLQVLPNSWKRTSL